MSAGSRRQAGLEALDDPVFFAGMISAIGQGAEILSAGTESVALVSHGTIQAWAGSLAAADDLLNLVDRSGRAFDRFVAHDEFTSRLARQRYGFAHITPCLSSAYLGTYLAPVSLPGVRVARLGPEHHPIISSHYAVDDPEYTAERIAAGVMTGAFRDDTLLVLLVF